MLEKNGVRLAGISYDSTQILKSFADQHGIVFIRNLAQVAQRLMYLGQLVVVLVLLVGVAKGIPAGQNRVVVQVGIFK